MSAQRAVRAAALACALLAGACKLEEHPQQLGGRGNVAAATSLECDADGGGITVPAGFCARVFADSVGSARHVTVARNGDVFIALADGPSAGGQRRRGVVALRDRDGDGHADTSVYFGDRAAHGIQLWNGWLYVDEGARIARYRVPEGALRPTTGGQPIVVGLPERGLHRARNFTISDVGTLYVNVGTATNACERARRAGPAQRPCAELRMRGGIWRFDARRPGQLFTARARFATGVRDATALAIGSRDAVLHAVIRGRDGLGPRAHATFDARYDAENAADELVRVREDDDFGWPYCYYAARERKRVLAPEYGGDGRTEGTCDDTKDPVAVFPAHSAPAAMAFYAGTLFPARYREGVFVVFQGERDATGRTRGLTGVVFQPVHRGDLTDDDFHVFASGFAAASPAGAPRHRPAGVAEGGGGALYLTDDVGGRVWRIVHPGGR